jgi:hypothetical protein
LIVHELVASSVTHQVVRGGIEWDAVGSVMELSGCPVGKLSSSDAVGAVVAEEPSKAKVIARPREKRPVMVDMTFSTSYDRKDSRSESQC